MVRRRLTGRERTIVLQAIGVVLLVCGAAEVAMARFWPPPQFAELSHYSGAFEESGWSRGSRFGRRTLRLQLSGTRYSYDAADAKMMALKARLSRGDRLDVWTQPVPGPFRGRIRQLQRGNELLVSYADNILSERERDRRYGMVGEALVGAGVALLIGSWGARRLLGHSRLEPGR